MALLDVRHPLQSLMPPPPSVPTLIPLTGSFLLHLGPDLIAHSTMQMRHHSLLVLVTGLLVLMTSPLTVLAANPVGGPALTLKATGPRRGIPGRSVLLKAILQNLSPAVIDDYALQLALPPFLTYESAKVFKQTPALTSNTSVLTWTLSDLRPKKSVRFTIKLALDECVPAGPLTVSLVAFVILNGVPSTRVPASVQIHCLSLLFQAMRMNLGPEETRLFLNSYAKFLTSFHYR